MRKIKILIVDDEVTVCRFLEQFLTSQGYQFKSAYSGREALNALSKEKFDLILLDILMPDMDGVEMMRRVRKSGSDIPVIALSGVKEEEIVQEVLELGVADFIPKPIDLDALAKSIVLHSN